MLRVSVPLADLRKEPKFLTPLDFSNNPLRESQLIYGEELKLIKSENDWFYVEAIEQSHLSKEGWQGYPGWVHISEVTMQAFEKPTSVSIAKDLTFGSFHAKTTRARPLTHIFSKKQFLEDALTFLDFPYLWGGTSFFSNDPIGSVDCSGLIYLLCRAQGKLIPRNAHDQYLKCQKIGREQLEPGDLIFWSSPENPDRMRHVVIYYDKTHFLEAPMTGKKVRILPLSSDFFIEKELQAFPDREKMYHTFCARLCYTN